VATVATYLVTFLVRVGAARAKLMVPPDSERVHTVPTATAGGTAMFIALGIALAVARFVPGMGFHAVFAGSNQAAGVLAAAGVMFVLGFVDDVREVSAPAKVAGQVLAAMVLYFAGATMLHFKVPFAGYLVLSPAVLPLVTALWVIGIANAVNLIDGLDGLAAGVVAIASGALCVYGLRLEYERVLQPNSIGPLIAAATCGLCVGFLPHNFHRAKIFMGDTGAMVLGLLMAASTMVIGGNVVPTWGSTYFFFVPLLVPFVILGVPILDTAFAIVRRTVRRTGVAVRDLEHLHHRLMRLGHGHRRTVLVLWAWTFLLSALVLYPTFDRSWQGTIPILALVMAVGLYTLLLPIRGRATEATSAALMRDGSAGGAGRAAVVGARGAGTAGAGGAAGDGPLAVTASTQSRGDGSGRVEAGQHRGQHRRRFARHQPPTRE
jgi:UDP-GlcNAc:undecaprenyl-phosphate GlcNAc-1-phosphate transferase